MLKRLELSGFKSFDKKTKLDFGARVSAIVGPNGSGKSNVAEALRWVLGEQSMKSMRGKKGEDLIWNGSKTVAKQNRASVSLAFDNKEKRFRVPYDEVVITREVYRDGINRYLINGSAVRLKDVLELLSVVGIGGTSHQIIGQGEADRLLRAKPLERREIIEEALGLNLYQFKKTESEKHLEKTEENIREVKLLRREIAPQILFLRREVEKLEKRDQVRDELEQTALTYLAHEWAYLAQENAELAAAKGMLSRERGGRSSDIQEIGEISRERGTIREKKEQVMRAIGRAEGLLSLLREPEDVGGTARATPAPESRSTHCRLCGQAVPEQVVHHEQATSHQSPQSQKPILNEETLLAEKAQHERELESLGIREGELKEKEQVIRHSLEVESEWERRKAYLVEHEGRILERDRAFKREISELIPLVGRSVLAYEKIPLIQDFKSEGETVHAERRRSMERLKIRLEELGAPDYAVKKEYETLVERDAHLAREVEDLGKTRASLLTLMQELAAEIGKRFEVGLAQINIEFNTYFGLLFGGGEAALIFEEPEEEGMVPGLELSVLPPNKRVKSLALLSGGERALTSIALLFAMSQVNPPPFLVLDETDAALDESNSRRYAEMIKRLSAHSQLVIITHNRETMAHAGILYGVTMGADGVSKVLSVKLD